MLYVWCRPLLLFAGFNAHSSTAFNSVASSFISCCNENDMLSGVGQILSARLAYLLLRGSLWEQMRVRRKI